MKAFIIKRINKIIVFKMFKNDVFSFDFLTK